MSEFAKWLANEMELRNQLGVNQLAEYSNVSSSMISNILNGKRSPSPKTVRKLAEYFKVDYDWLLAKAGHRNNEPVETNPAVENFKLFLLGNQATEEEIRELQAIAEIILNRHGTRRIS